MLESGAREQVCGGRMSADPGSVRSLPLFADEYGPVALKDRDGLLSPLARREVRGSALARGGVGRHRPGPLIYLRTKVGTQGRWHRRWTYGWRDVFAEIQGAPVTRFPTGSSHPQRSRTRSRPMKMPGESPTCVAGGRGQPGEDVAPCPIAPTPSAIPGNLRRREHKGASR